MGIYIKGMEMPTDGFITITVTSDGRVLGNSKKISGVFKYLDNEDIAIAVSVPPHGRLIDADEFFEALNMDDKTTIVEAMHISELLVEAPTVIPDEEETDGSN